jgi:coproporphyrinogen III oxidase-like Fe-S oxidoreductase
MSKALADGNAISTTETLTRSQALGEFVFLNLRQLEGFPHGQFAQRFGIEFVDAFPHVADLIAEGLLAEEDGKIKLTFQGLLLADSIFASFF